jgi:hypothetical protein
LIFYIASELAGVDMGPYEDAGAESYPGFDVFDWNRKDNIAAAIIATWEKYDEQVDEKFLDPENLTKAIDGYKGDWNQASMFRIACEVAGVDFGSYEGSEDD